MRLRSADTHHTEIQGPHPNGTAPRRFELRFKISRFVFRPCPGLGTFRVGLKSPLKAGHHISFSEARSMDFFASHTFIPVPKVLQTWLDPNTGVPHILMEFVAGKALTFVWDRMSPKTKKKVVDQLKEYMDQLRNLKPPAHLAGHVCAVDGSPLIDLTRIDVHPSFGPYQTHSDFHEYLRATLSFDALRERNKPGYQEILIRTPAPTCPNSPMPTLHQET